MLKRKRRESYASMRLRMKPEAKEAAKLRKYNNDLKSRTKRNEALESDTAAKEAARVKKKDGNAKAAKKRAELFKGNPEAKKEFKRKSRESSARRRAKKAEWFKANPEAKKKNMIAREENFRELYARLQLYQLIKSFN
jgi:hypothetical protein